MNQPNNKDPLTFVVYFEIFGLKKKYTVCDNSVATQNQAEMYVKTILVPRNIVFYDSVQIKKTNEKNPFESFTDLFGKTFGDFLNFKNKK